MYSDPDYEGPEDRRDPLRGSDYLPRSSCGAPRRLRGRGDHDRPLARPLPRGFREKGLAREHGHPAPDDHGYLLGERGLTGKVPSQLHPELAQVPFIVVHPDGRAAGDATRTSPRPTTWVPRCVAGRLKPPSWMEGADLSRRPRRREADPVARLPLRRHVQPLLHPHGRLGPDRRQPRRGAGARRPEQDPHEFFDGREEEQDVSGSCTRRAERGRRAAAVLQ